MGDKEEKKKKNPAPAPKTAKRKKKKGPPPAVKIPAGKDSTALDLDDANETFLFSVSYVKMQVEATEIRAYQGLPLDGARVHSKSGAAQTTGGAERCKAMQRQI
jgi:hypothetical protein